MHVTIGSTTTTEERTFRCGACGHRARARVTGFGEGAQSFLNASGTVEARAEADARADVDRTLSVAACPRCGQRSRDALVRWWVRHLLPLVLVTAVIALSGWLPLLLDLDMSESDKPIVGWIMTGIAAFLAVPFAFTVAMRWQGTARRVQFLDQTV